MDYDNFKNWCFSKEPKLNKYTFYYHVRDNTVFVWLGLLIFVLKALEYFNIVNVFSIIATFILSILLVMWVEEKISLPMSQTKFIACLLHKIGTEIQILEGEKEKKDLIHNLKEFKTHSKFKQDFHKNELFKKAKKIQEKFFDSLQSLPDRIYYLLEEKNLNTINSEDIKRLAFYIYTDDERKVELLEKITRENPDVREIKNQFDFFFEKLYKNKLVRYVFSLIALAFISYFLAYKYLGIDKNYIFIGFITISLAVYTKILKK